MGKDNELAAAQLRRITADEERGIQFSEDKRTLLRYNADLPDQHYTIPNGVTCIGDAAFARCTNLTSVIIPDGVTVIMALAFLECTGLTAIQIPDSAKVFMGPSIFEGCSSLKAVNIPQGVMTGIGISMFENCSSLTTVDILDGVTEIGARAFAGCSNLTTINIPESVDFICNNAFEDCAHLTVKIPHGVSRIGKWAFCGCYKVVCSENPRYYTDETGVLIDRETNTLLYAPYNISDAYSIPMGVKEIGEAAFAGSNLTSVNIPDSVATIEDMAFAYCSNLTSVNIPDSVTRIATRSFEGCTALTVNIPMNLEIIEESAFSGCCNVVCPASRRYYADKTGALIDRKTETLLSVCNISGTYTIPKNVTSIGFGAFSHCRKLTKVILHDGVTRIGQTAFEDCENLTSVNIPSGATVGWLAFTGCSRLTVEIKEGFTDFYGLGNSCCIKVACPGSRRLCVDKNGVLIDKKTKTLLFACNISGAYTIPEGITTIGPAAFSHCRDLTSVAIPNRVNIRDRAFCECHGLLRVDMLHGAEHIEKEAFAGCISLTTVNICDSVTSIGDNAFCGCESLTNIIIPDGLTVIGEGAFADCSNLAHIGIPDSVKSIGQNAFVGCFNLTTLNIPNGVTRIEFRTFGGCSSLTDVRIPKSVTYISDAAFYGCPCMDQPDFKLFVESRQSKDD